MPVDDAAAAAQGNATLRGRPGFLARRLHQIHVAFFLAECAEAQLTPIQWGIMTVIAGQAGMGHQDIAAEMGIDRSNAADVLVRLADRGIVTLRRSTTDRRKKCAYLTPRGRSIMQRFETQVRRSQNRMLQPLNATERKVFMTLLRRLVDHNNDFSRAPLRLSRADVVTGALDER